MTLLNPILLISDIAKKVNKGSTSDVDYFMSYLNMESSTQTIKLVDFAISQIRSVEGVKRLKYYLCNGTTLHKNYAALYFKRHKKILLDTTDHNFIEE